jgi:hypothetical protein
MQRWRASKRSLYMKRNEIGAASLVTRHTMSIGYGAGFRKTAEHGQEW